MTGLFVASVYSLRARVDQLGADLDYWSARADDPHDLGLHQSQMQRLRRQIDATLAAAVDGTPLVAAAAPDPDGDLAAIAGLRRVVGTVHLIWEFFRDKLAQRDVDLIRRHLAAADDLAWACYQPFVDAACTADPSRSFSEIKEPPLVFYGVDRAPYAQARTMTLRPQGLDASDTRAFSAALHRLPVPVISMPWSVANRMPEVVLIGHEAGHVVAEDIGLSDAIADRLAALDLVDDVDGGRAAVWRSWADEVWADVFGTVATGSSYVAGLAAELVADPLAIRSERIAVDSPGGYPTASLRIALCEAVLALIGIDPDPAWCAIYREPRGDSGPYVVDLKTVVRALADEPWPQLDGKSLVSLLPWGPDAEAAVRQVSRAQLGGFPPAVVYDVRTWVAAAMASSRTDPERYRADRLDVVIANEIHDRRQDMVRSTATSRRTVVGAGVAARLAAGSLDGGGMSALCDGRRIDRVDSFDELDDAELGELEAELVALDDRAAGRELAELLGIASGAAPPTDGAAP